MALKKVQVHHDYVCCFSLMLDYPGKTLTLCTVFGLARASGSYKLVSYFSAAVVRQSSLVNFDLLLKQDLLRKKLRNQRRTKIILGSQYDGYSTVSASSK